MLRLEILRVIRILGNPRKGFYSHKIGSPETLSRSLITCGISPGDARRVFQYDAYLRSLNLRNGNGCIVEAGVGKGATLGYLLKLQKFFGDERVIYCFDTFEGFPRGSENDSQTFINHGKPGYEKFTLEYIHKYLVSIQISNSELSRIDFRKGYIPESFMGFPEKSVDFLNCDLDLYEPTKATLEFFWPLMTKGGIVLLDEYDLGLDELKWPGAKKAVDEFCKQFDVQVQKGFADRAFLLKP